jgi:hypothetical protein
VHKARVPRRPYGCSEDGIFRTEGAAPWVSAGRFLRCSSAAPAASLQSSLRLASRGVRRHLPPVVLHELLRDSVCGQFKGVAGVVAVLDAQNRQRKQQSELVRRSKQALIEQPLDVNYEPDLFVGRRRHGDVKGNAITKRRDLNWWPISILQPIPHRRLIAAGTSSTAKVTVRRKPCGLRLLGMNITANLLEAFVRCPTKCYLSGAGGNRNRKCLCRLGSIKE